MSGIAVRGRAIGCAAAAAFLTGAAELGSGWFTGDDGSMRSGAVLMVGAMIAPFIVARFAR